MNKSRFLKIKCPKCGKTTIIFGKASTKVKCSDCNAELVRPSGGKAQIKAAVKEVL